MPTEEEYQAIMCLCIKAGSRLKHLEGTQEQLEIVVKWADKWLKRRAKNNKIAKEYMRKRREIDPDYGHYYVPKEGGGRTQKRPANYKEYQHEYYLNVRKPKRQAERIEKWQAKKDSQ